MTYKALGGLLMTLAAALQGQQVAAAQLPAAIQAIEARGAEIVGQFDAPGGLQGYAARYNGEGLALYLTADGEHVLIGSLLDAQGEDLTRPQLETWVYEPMAKEMWQKLEQSAWIQDGATTAPRTLYVFSDPNCPYCNAFWRSARPWVEAGDVQIRHVMVGMLRPDSAAKAAALLAASDPQQALKEHEAAGKQSKLVPLSNIPEAVNAKLTANLMLMGELGAVATPAIYYLDSKGRLQQHQGAPRAEALGEIMGPRSATP